METGDLRDKALEHIEKSQWVPQWGHERIVGMMKTRPDWCLSRQRSWGIPIIAFTCTDCEHTLIEKTVIDHVADIFEAETSDVWFEKEAGELLPEGTKCKKCGGTSFEKETDILDVWFDSGVSHAAVCEADDALGWPVDLYLEGSDQHRGWFNTSLLTSVATRGRAPFETVLTHGFVVAGDGRKMSKSLGNTIAPQKIIDKFGAEVLRLWVSSEDYRDDIRISDEIVQRLTESYRRIRNTCRFMLGNLGGFDPKDAMPLADRSELDRWILAKTETVAKRVIDAYNNYEFHAVYHSLHNLCAVELSSIYMDVCKDRLYASAPDDSIRRSTQSTMFDVLVRLTQLLAPICAFTSEEVWANLPDFEGKTDSVHLSLFAPIDEQVADAKLLEKWDALLAVRREVNKAIELARQEKVVGHNLDALVRVEPGEEAKAVVSDFGPLLKEVLSVSVLEKVDALTGDNVFESEILVGLKVQVAKSPHGKCNRCWGFFEEVGTLDNPELCARCADVVSRLDIETE
jgi:isoleucyl-tRNA synthetase